MLQTHDLFNKHLDQYKMSDDKCKMYYSKLVDKFYEGCYGGWNYPTRGRSSIVNGTKEVAPLLWVKRAAAAAGCVADEPPEFLLANFRAPKVVVRPLPESVVKDVEARNSEQPGPSTSGSSRTSTSRTTNNKRIRAEESIVIDSSRKKLKRSCTSRSTSSDIVNLSDEDSSKQEESSDPENTPLKNVRNTNISNNFCLQINFVIKYTFLLHLGEER
jgi:hypothetical protein